MKILDVKIDDLVMKETLQKVESFLKDNQQHQIVTPNPEFLVRAQKDKEFKAILNQADLAIPDGTGLLFAARFLGQPLRERVAGTDLMEEICRKAAQKGWLICLLGGLNNVAEMARNNLKNRYPGLEIRVLDELGIDEPGCIFASASLDNCQKPVILFIALGAPMQEKWIAQNLKKLSSVKLAIGVGGAFDFIAGRVSRAPHCFRLMGLEWLWRLFYQPWRAKRIFQAIIEFPLLVIKEKITRYYRA